MHTILVVLVTIFLVGCLEDEDERYDVGYDDGYAVGYNTTCKIRATLIEGDWNSPAYSRGYEAGYAGGSAECLSKN